MKQTYQRPITRAQNKMKRILLLGDLHCGHRVGLTPPGWHWNKLSDADNYKKWGALQQGTWDWYVQKVRELGRIHLVVVNGDLIDGQGAKTSGTELITTDRSQQVDMAIKCLQEINAKHIIVVRGTGYHTGEGEDWEDLIGKGIHADKVEDHAFFDINGLTFDCKHHIGGSSVPHGRATPGMRDALWNLIWADRKLQRAADILIRSHVHYFSHSSGIRANQLVMTLPGLQGFGSKYGARRMSGIVDVGMVHFDVQDKENYTWKKHILNPEYLAASITKY